MKILLSTKLRCSIKRLYHVASSQVVDHVLKHASSRLKLNHRVIVQRRLQSTFEDDLKRKDLTGNENQENGRC